MEEETPKPYNQSNNGGPFSSSAPPYEKHSSTDHPKPGNGGGGSGGSEHFIVEDLLDFSNDDDDAVLTDATDSSSVTVVDNGSNSNSNSFSGSDPQSGFFIQPPPSAPAPAGFSDDLCVPYDDLAELEWLSNFVEESFSSKDLQKLQLISGMKSAAGGGGSSNPIFDGDISVPAKARSKRSRAAAGNWASSLTVLYPASSSPSSSSSTTSTADPPGINVVPPTGYNQHPAMTKKAVKATAPKRRDGGGEGRKCLHCATDKTPQWRTGPLGPKTLCNACGVRYKSGRLVPEYRPAASPTFVLTKHSNSHRKVMELRRQKEMMKPHHHQTPTTQFLHRHSHYRHYHHRQIAVFDGPANGGGDEYLIHQHVGPDFRQLI